MGAAGTHGCAFGWPTTEKVPPVLRRRLGRPRLLPRGPWTDRAAGAGAVEQEVIAMSNRPAGSVAGVWVRFILGLAILSAGLVLARFLHAQGGWSWGWLVLVLVAASVFSGRL